MCSCIYFYPIILLNSLLISKLYQYNQYIKKIQKKKAYNNISQIKMRKQVILKMQGNQYPFGQLTQPSNNKTKIDSRILVRKIHETRTLQQRKNLLDSIHTIKNIKNDYLMKIQNVLEQDNSIHILYQYVPNSLLKNISNMTTVTINIIKDQLLDLSKNLAQVGFKIQWDSKNIGINDKMQVKYYLDLSRINVDQVSGKIKLLKLHTQNIMQIIGQLSKGIKGTQKNVANNKNNKIQIPPEATKLQNARAANSIESNTDVKRYKFPQSQQNDKIKTSQQNKIIPKPKFSQKLQLKQQQVPSLPLKKSRTDWKQVDQNQEFMKDFINVLDDKSQNAQSKYLSQDQQRQGDQQQQVEQQFMEMDLPANGKNYVNQQEQEQQGQEEQQIVWVSAPEEDQENYQQQKINNEGQDQDQEVGWVDYQDIKNRAQQAIKRSTNALATFKSILCKNK